MIGSVHRALLRMFFGDMGLVSCIAPTEYRYEEVSIVEVWDGLGSYEG